METKKKTIYTDKIRDGVLKLTEMEVGTTVSGTVTGINPNGTKYGPTIQLTLKNGSAVEIVPAGNVKRFVLTDLQKGTRPLNTFMSITRKEDRVFNNRPTSQFYVYQDGYKFEAKSNAPAQTTTNTSLKDVKAALRS